jgi:hypothetical protein
MRKLAIGIVAAGTLVAAATIVPASAQVRFEGPGIGLRIGPDHPGYYHYGWDRGRHYGWRHRDRNCRTVTVRERQWDGTVVVRTRERC